MLDRYSNKLHKTKPLRTSMGFMLIVGLIFLMAKPVFAGDERNPVITDAVATLGATDMTIDITGMDLCNEPALAGVCFDPRVELGGLLTTVVSATDTHVVVTTPVLTDGSYLLMLKTQADKVRFELDIAGAGGGVAGSPGPQGPEGLAGAQGLIGLTGPTGSNGGIGPAGPQGLSGLAGSAGADGAPGLKGLNWRGAWTGGIEYNADDAVEHLGNSYVANQFSMGAAPDDLLVSAWDLLAMKGDQGSAGPAGTAGADGSAGAAGATGSIGPIGFPGASGADGLNGLDGAGGPAGPAGAVGPQGLQGFPGLGQTINLTIDPLQFPGIVAQDFVTLFSDSVNNTAQIDFSGGLTGGGEIVIINGPGVEIQKIPGFDEFGNSFDHSGLAQELPSQSQI